MAQMQSSVYANLTVTNVLSCATWWDTNLGDTLDVSVDSGSIVNEDMDLHCVGSTPYTINVSAVVTLVANPESWINTVSITRAGYTLTWTGAQLDNGNVSMPFPTVGNDDGSGLYTDLQQVSFDVSATQPTAYYTFVITETVTSV